MQTVPTVVAAEKVAQGLEGLAGQRTSPRQDDPVVPQVPGDAMGPLAIVREAVGVLGVLLGDPGIQRAVYLVGVGVYPGQPPR